MGKSIFAWFLLCLTGVSAYTPLASAQEWTDYGSVLQLQAGWVLDRTLVFHSAPIKNPDRCGLTSNGYIVDENALGRDTFNAMMLNALLNNKEAAFVIGGCKEDRPEIISVAIRPPPPPPPPRDRYVFKLREILSHKPRDDLQDTNVVTFSVLVNQIDRGHGTCTFSPLFKNTQFPAALCPPNNRFNINKSWEVGPLELQPGDVVNVVYTGTNIADSQSITLQTADQDKIELKILDAIVSGAVGTIGGPVGSIVGGILGLIGDPVGTIIGFEPTGPCNGPVFSDSRTFTGAGLDGMAMAPLAGQGNRLGTSFTFSYTDEASHPAEHCGAVANTSITFDIFRIPQEPPVIPPCTQEVSCGVVQASMLLLSRPQPNGGVIEAAKLLLLP